MAVCNVTHASYSSSVRKQEGAQQCQTWTTIQAGNVYPARPHTLILNECTLAEQFIRYIYLVCTLIIRFTPTII